MKSEKKQTSREDRRFFPKKKKVRVCSGAHLHAFTILFARNNVWVKNNKEERFRNPEMDENDSSNISQSYT